MANKGLRWLIISIVIGLVLLTIIGIIVYLVRRGAHSTIKPDAHSQPNQTVTVYDTSTRRNQNLTFFGAFPVVNLIRAGSDSCPLPGQFRTDYDFDYLTKAGEYRDTTSPIDYFRLTLSWSPTYCDGQRNSDEIFQCKGSFGFIVHGLWPTSFKENSNSYPRNCRSEEKMPIDLIRKYFCMMPSEYLMQSEWEKHGTCYWQTPEEYFEKMKNLYSNIQIPKNIDEIISDKSLSKQDLLKNIKQTFLDNNPQLTWNNIDVKIGGEKKLKEVAFCYDLNFNYIQCKPNM